jgi:hypothetical protein
MIREYYITDKMYKLTEKFNPELLAETLRIKKQYKLNAITDEIGSCIDREVDKLKKDIACTLEQTL